MYDENAMCTVSRTHSSIHPCGDSLCQCQALILLLCVCGACSSSHFLFNSPQAPNGGGILARGGGDLTRAAPLSCNPNQTLIWGFRQSHAFTRTSCIVFEKAEPLQSSVWNKIVHNEAKIKISTALCSVLNSGGLGCTDSVANFFCN